MKKYGFSIDISSIGKAIKKTVKDASKSISDATRDAGKNIKNTTKDAWKSTKDATKDAGKSINDAAKVVIDKGKEAAAWLLFQPVKPVAKAYLRNRGVNPDGNDRTLVSKVYAEMQKKTFGFDGNVFDLSIHDFPELVLEEGDESENYGFDPVTIGIVMLVITFLTGLIKKNKEKKAAGEKLTAAEQALDNVTPQLEQFMNLAKIEAGGILDESEQTADDIKNGTIVYNTAPDEGWFNWKIGGAVLLILLVIGYFIFRKK